MTLTESDLSELLAAVQAGDMTHTIRTSLAWVLQQLIEAEATATIGAAPHERSNVSWRRQLPGGRQRRRRSVAEPSRRSSPGAST